MERSRTGSEREAWSQSRHTSRTSRGSSDSVNPSPTSPSFSDTGSEFGWSTQQMEFPQLADGAAGTWEPDKGGGGGGGDGAGGTEIGDWRSQNVTATGWFSKKAKGGRGKTKNRWFELKGALVRYFRDTQQDGNGHNKGVGQKGDILIVPHKTRSAAFGRVLTITTMDRVYELEADDPLQAAQWHGAITAVAQNSEMGWWLKKAESIGAEKERYFELDVATSEIRYFTKTGVDGKGKAVAGKIRVHGKTVVLPCDTTLHIINLARTWELTSPTNDRVQVMTWAKKIQDIAARLRAAEAEADGTVSTDGGVPGSSSALRPRGPTGPGQARMRPISTSPLDLYTDEEWLEIEQYDDEALAGMMSTQIADVEKKLQQLRVTEGGRYTMEELYAPLPPLPPGPLDYAAGDPTLYEAVRTDHELTAMMAATMADQPDYVSIRALYGDADKASLDTVLIYESGLDLALSAPTPSLNRNEQESFKRSGTNVFGWRSDTFSSVRSGGNYDTVDMIEANPNYDTVDVMPNSPVGPGAPPRLKPRPAAAAAAAAAAVAAAGVGSGRGITLLGPGGGGHAIPAAAPKPAPELAIDWAHWEIDRTQIELVNLFGEGEFGEVWAGKLIGKGERKGYVAAIAAKALKPGKMQMRGEFLAEAHFMTRIHHANVVNLYGVCTVVEPTLIISELCRNGCLHEYLKGQRMLKKRLKWNSLLRFMAECCDAMAYLEDTEIVHRDLAARNVLLDKNLVCKIADFGMARDVHGLPSGGGGGGGGVYIGDPADRVPVRWCAPEALRDSAFSFKSDVWSFGVLMFEIATHSGDLYTGSTNQEVCMGVMCTLRLEQPPDCSDSLYALMQSCWAADPRARASFKHLLTQLTTDVALANTAQKPKGLVADAAVIIKASKEPTYIQIKQVLVARYGKKEFDKAKQMVQAMLQPSPT